MITFVKTQAASFIATCVDFAITVFCKEILGLWYAEATILGTMSGGVTGFLLGRKWVFKKETTKVRTQAIRYFWVWSGNLMANVAGVFALTNYLHFNYIVSKICVSGILGFTYSYLLQKKYVFK